tara:strand:+ start:357 stop:566 length:210 start_codon:yes stop_codon:yes gene_type:complete
MYIEFNSVIFVEGTRLFARLVVPRASVNIKSNKKLADGVFFQLSLDEIFIKVFWVFRHFIVTIVVCPFF